ncbi:uncharacterized protein EI90DRAFT_3059973 [Cantharellus anzutake]|uniref:uncharacterized protein n=1 Tax=Cantharellus anzutake TaxID=1750568 RepID=UPI0019085CEE|nr:uncharacterized protein EI90DRAFT_3059973 [Cantharellus anzutake]KAF8330566.1 hypothetical protein EI90DRAFT_3059973 [Cantharellus anzutake]
MQILNNILEQFFVRYHNRSTICFIFVVSYIHVFFVAFQLHNSHFFLSCLVYTCVEPIHPAAA